MQYWFVVCCFGYHAPEPRGFIISNIFDKQISRSWPPQLLPTRTQRWQAGSTNDNQINKIPSMQKATTTAGDNLRLHSLSRMGTQLLNRASTSKSFRQSIRALCSLCRAVETAILSHTLLLSSPHGYENRPVSINIPVATTMHLHCPDLSPSVTTFTRWVLAWLLILLC